MCHITDHTSDIYSRFGIKNRKLSHSLVTLEYLLNTEFQGRSVPKRNGSGGEKPTIFQLRSLKLPKRSDQKNLSFLTYLNWKTGNVPRSLTFFN